MPESREFPLILGGDGRLMMAAKKKKRKKKGPSLSSWRERGRGERFQTFSSGFLTFKKAISSRKCLADRSLRSL